MSVGKSDFFVSVIMPAYNSEKYIAQSIESVIAQTYKEWELIIVDDGSTDNTGTIIKEFASKDQRVKYFYQENGRQAKARNFALFMAKGEILAFLDSDDLWLPDKLEISLNYFLKNNIDLLFTDAYYISDSIYDYPDPNYPLMGYSNCTYNGMESIRMFIEGNRIATLTVLVKKNKVIELGGFDSNCVPAEDYDLWIRLLKSGAIFKSVSDRLSAYRLLNNSSSSSDRSCTQSSLIVLKKNFQYVEIKNLDAIIFIKKWILKWVNCCLNKNNYDDLDSYVRHFGFYSSQYNFFRKVRCIIGLKIYKFFVYKILNNT